VGGSGIDQEGVTDLSDISQSLDRRRVQGFQRGWIEADVVPEGIADEIGKNGKDGKIRKGSRLTDS
jgi:hypothetical protein